jgi:hypothetical protein
MSKGPVYLGDGVYCTFDGFYIHLHVGAHDNPPVVALDPDVLAALNEYARSIREATNV